MLAMPNLCSTADCDSCNWMSWTLRVVSAVCFFTFFVYIFACLDTPKAVFHDMASTVTARESPHGYLSADPHANSANLAFHTPIDANTSFPADNFQEVCDVLIAVKPGVMSLMNVETEQGILAEDIPISFIADSSMESMHILPTLKKGVWTTYAWILVGAVAFVSYLCNMQVSLAGHSPFICAKAGSMIICTQAFIFCITR